MCEKTHVEEWHFKKRCGSSLFINGTLGGNGLMSGGNEIPYILNRACSFQLKVCLSMLDVLLSLHIKELTLFIPGMGEYNILAKILWGICVRHRIFGHFVRQKLTMFPLWPLDSGKHHHHALPRYSKIFKRPSLNRESLSWYVRTGFIVVLCACFHQV